MSNLASELREVAVTLPDGAVRRYSAGVTGAEIAADISKSLGKAAFAVLIDGRLSDLSQPIARDVELAIVTAKDEAPALELIRHDAAHIMARAVQEFWPDVKVTIGPVIENGWYYDFDRKEPFTPEESGDDQPGHAAIIAARNPVRTEVWDRDRAIRHYEALGEPYKVELVEAIPEADPVRMYWHGHWQDLCRGPHLANTGQVPADAFKLMSIAGAYWRGDRGGRCCSGSTARPSARGRTSTPTCISSRRRRSATTGGLARRWTSSTCSRRRRGRSSGTRTGSRYGGCSRPTSAGSSTPTAMWR